MRNPEKYGKPPFETAVIHGGPGAPGEMAPVARELSKHRGILEPLQSATSVDGQVEELKTLLEEHGDLPVTLIGHSWGAWLVFVFAARHPSLVSKVILVGSGPFEAKYAESIMPTRLSRLSKEDRAMVETLMNEMNNSAAKNKTATMSTFGKLLSKADSFDPLPHDDEVKDFQLDVYQGVWPEAAELRKSGKLLKLGEKIQCPVIAIHGEYDPHPGEGIKKPLSLVLKDFEFIELDKCGHDPWIERHAKDKFYEILNRELS
jgi:pimeloyl-ACP methyl ester carboxylesterase